jgi:hypothetical protein
MGLLDAISPTPRNRILGLLADATQGVNDFASKPFGYDNPPARMLMGLLGVPSIATTLDRLSYGEPLTNIGKANVPLLKPETADAAMAAAAALPAVSRGALKASDAAVRAITRNPEATATKVMDYAAQMNPMNPMVVYHGSPHKFDKFDSSKIGTGEGAQAYGHGLYLAESPKVAESYSGKLSSELKYNGRPMNRESSRNSRDSAAWALYLADGDREAAKASGLAKPELIDALDPAKLKAGGQLYKVDLPDSAIAKMLDWDKPLSQQAPEVQQALKAAGIADADNWMQTGLRGSEVYKRAKTGAPAKLPLRQVDDEIFAAQRLRAAGIPGVRYLDGGSRGVGAGSSNFVVFPGEESLLSILERNGVTLK